MSIAERDLAFPATDVLAESLITGRQTRRDFYGTPAFMPIESQTLTPQTVQNVIELRMRESIASAQAQIAPILQYPPNWDGYHSPPLNPALASISVAVLAQLLFAGIASPDVNPTRTGGISLEWDREDTYLEIEVEGAANVIDVTYFYKSKNPDQSPLRGSVTDSAFLGIMRLFAQ